LPCEEQEQKKLSAAAVAIAAVAKMHCLQQAKKLIFHRYIVISAVGARFSSKVLNARQMAFFLEYLTNQSFLVADIDEAGEVRFVIKCAG